MAELKAIRGGKGGGYFRLLILLILFVSTNAVVQLVKDGGARDEGMNNWIYYEGWLNSVQAISALASIPFIIFSFRYLRCVLGEKVYFPLFALIVWAGVSFLWAASPYIAVRTASLLGFGLWVMVFAAYMVRADVLIGIFRFLFVFLAWASLFLVFFYPDYGISVGSEHSGKWQGVFDHKNGLGNFFSIAVGFHAWEYLFRSRKAALINLIVAMMLVVGSQSYTALFNSMVSMVFATIIRFGSVIDLLRSSKIFVVLCILSIPFVPLVVSVFFGGGVDMIFTGREYIWELVLEKVAYHPWIGHGFAQFFSSASLGGVGYELGGGFVFGSTHNGPLDLIFGLGMVGLLLFFAFIIGVWSLARWSSFFSLYLIVLIQFSILNSSETRFFDYNFFIFYLVAVSAIAVSSRDMARGGR